MARAKHATDAENDGGNVTTLCGRDPAIVLVDNIEPACKTCLRIIAKRTAEWYAKGCR